MHKNKKSLISLLLAIVMIAGALASCGNVEEATTSTPSNTTTEQIGEYSTEKSPESTTDGSTEENSENQTEEVTEPIIEELVGPYADVIENANELANKVQDNYFLENPELYYIKNQNMSLEYALPSTYDQQIIALKNTQGAAYIENTFDTFVKMTNGDVYYTSKTDKNAVVNVFRYGYYYNEVRFEGQDLYNGSTIFKEVDIPLSIEMKNDVTAKSSKGVLSVRISDFEDPYISFIPFSHSTDEYKYVQFTLKNSVAGASARVYIIAGDKTSYASQYVDFSLYSDGEYHTYDIYLADVEGYTGNITQVRLDLEGFNVGDSVEINSVKLFDGEINGAPTLSVARIFHAYSDKLHHELQLVASETTSDIAEIGMITKISANTVDKIIVKDKNGIHDALESVDWNSAEYIGFDIKGVGIFGYILPVHETTGKMVVTLDGGNYVIVQSRAPENNTVIAGTGGYGDTKNVTGNTNDFYMGQRLYTDENHTFDAFITEAEIERNPLTAKNIKVSSVYSNSGAHFVGYDTIRGSYEFYIPGTEFNVAYYQQPNRHYGINFTIRSDKYDRNVYILATSDSANLECAVVLDEKLMMLPIPIEVGKNFGTDKDNNIYDRLDLAYSDAIFPIVVTGNESLEYNVLHLYQNWGNYPLKQISFIEYYVPYYHFSTGVTETNCINVLAGPEENLLPDHRGMSAPLWSDQPQHTSSGFHTVFYYKNDKGHMIYTTLTDKVIDSYGPIYADVKMTFVSEDGKIRATYTHMEMPQTDENRGYYVMEYEFLEDISFKSFKDSFNFYTVSDNDPTGQYQLFGYLNENNEPTLINANITGARQYYVLGTEAPYFDYCNMKNCNGAGGPGGTYGNVSFIICSSEIIAGGKVITPNFAVIEGNLRADLTLDLGTVDFKAGDKITINALITPWGSEISDYSGESFAPDQNVLDMRENTALNPATLTAIANSEVIDSAFLPKIKTTNGKSAEFTISGGENNIAIRAYGFTDLTAPKVYEKINGEWVEYKLSSSGNPDISGYHTNYDGYGVYYDGDGTYSYAFIVTMTDGAPRTFKIETDDSFKGWSRIEVEEIVLDKLPVYIDHMEINKSASSLTFGHIYYKSCEIVTENNKQFSRLTPKLYDDGYNESYSIFYTYDETAPTVSGQYLVIKYRTNASENSYFEVFTSTQNKTPVGGDNTRVISAANGLYIADEEWHIVIIDLAALCNTFNPDADGNYIAKYLRLDTTQDHSNYTNLDIYTDLAYIGITGDLTEAITLDTSVSDVLFYDGSLTVYDSVTGDPK